VLDRHVLDGDPHLVLGGLVAQPGQQLGNAGIIGLQAEIGDVGGFPEPVALAARNRQRPEVDHDLLGTPRGRPLQVGQVPGLQRPLVIVRMGQGRVAVQGHGFHSGLLDDTGDALEFVGLAEVA